MTEQPQDPQRRFTLEELEQLSRYLEQRDQRLQPEPQRKSLGSFGEGMAVGLVLALGIAIALWAYVNSQHGVTLSFN